jgi:hypothetical protein
MSSALIYGALTDTHSILWVNEGVVYGNDFDIIMLDASRR